MRKTLLYKKSAHKILVKLIPGDATSLWFVCELSWIRFRQKLQSHWPLELVLINTNLYYSQVFKCFWWTWKTQIFWNKCNHQFQIPTRLLNSGWLTLIRTQSKLIHKGRNFVWAVQNLFFKSISDNEKGSFYLATWARIHNTSFSSYLKYKPSKLECFITPH